MKSLSASKSSAPVFKREATGLVRTLGFVDQFIFSCALFNMFGAVFTILYAPFYFPGANLPLVFLIGAIPAFALAYVYSRFSAGMPRSGGDYVWSSRVFGPLYGAILIIFFIAANITLAIGTASFGTATIALVTLFSGLAVTTNNQGFAQTAIALGTPGLGFPVALITVFIGIGLALLSLRIYAVIQKVTYVIYYVILVVLILLLVTVNTTQFPALFDHSMRFFGSQATYNGLLQQASSANAGGFNLTNTILAAIPWGFFYYAGFNFNTALAGETRDAKSTFNKALFSAVIVAVIVGVLLAVLSVSAFGGNFLNAVAYVESNNPSMLPVLPTVAFLVALTNPVVAVLLGIGLWLGWLWVTTSMIVVSSRSIFAGAFDRLLPDKLADVNDRFSSPHWAVLVVGVLALAYETIYWLAGYASTWLNTSLVAPIAYMLPLFATLAMVFRKPALFKETVGQFAKTSAIVIASLVGLISFGFYLIAEMFPIASGVFLGTSLMIAIGVVLVMGVIAFAFYFVAAMKLQKVGLQISQIYAELPPE